ncbi:unnamed protein product [Scytosiphon promiscuus]
MVLLHRSAAVALQRLAAGEVVGVAAKLASRGAWLQQWLGHEGSTEIREAFAETAGAAAEFMDPNSELVPFLRALGHKLKVRRGCITAVSCMVTRCPRSSAIGHPLTYIPACRLSFARPRLHACLFSPTAALHDARCSRLHQPSQDALPASLSSVAAAIGHPVSLLHVAACGAVGRVGAAGPLPVRTGPRSGCCSTWRRTRSVGGKEDPRLLRCLESIITRLLGDLHPRTARCDLDLSSRIAQQGAKYRYKETGACRANLMVHTLRPRPDRSAAVHRKRRSPREDYRSSPLIFAPKKEELQFAVGAAVADLACSGPLQVPSGKVLEDMRASALAARRELKEETVKDGGVLVDALNYVLYQVLYVLLEDHSPHISGAAAVYLLAVVQRCRGHPVLAAYLPDVQAAFTRKLTVRSEFVQEVAGKGLALVYQAAGRDSKQGLVDSLVDALSTGRRRAAGSAAMTGSGGAGGVDVHGASHAGAALSEAGAGAYGEMCAVANDVGRPDLIYSFLSMASHHAAWTTRRGASFGLGAIINQVSAEAFGGQLERIVPRLFRYRFDPSAKTRAAMEQLWRAVVGGGNSGGDFSTREKEVVHSNLSAILTELLRALGDRKWRDRQSACAGLSDVLRGRSWDEIGPHLEMLWTMADRGLDDIKESVAEAAVDYAKTVANISVRLCDPYSFEAGEARRTIGTMLEDIRASEAEARARGEEGTDPAARGGLATAEGRDAAADEVGPTVDEILRPGRAGAERNGPPPSEAAKAAAAGAVGVTLPWLLRKGILSRCKPSQALAMRTLQRLVKVCDKEALMPHLAELVATLIEGLSALEPQALQYMQFHAETQLEMTQDQMERLRLSVSRAGPLQDALDNCYRHLDHAGVVDALMPRLLGLLRSGTGLATRSASAYLVLSLCERAPLEIHRAAPRLLPTLTNTALSERSSTLRRTYSSALSSVARLAPAAGVSRLASRLAQLFREADPDFDKRQRRTLALLLGDLCRRAGGQLGAPGTSTAAATAAAARGVGGGGTEGGGGLPSDGSRDGSGSPGGGAGGGFFSSGWAEILPVAFVARSDPDKPVADAFQEAWQEGLTQLQLGAAGQGEAYRVRNAKDAVLLMLPSVLAEVSRAVSSVSRVTKRQGCSGLKDLASILGPSLGEARSGRRLVRRVLSQVPGRTWEGKEELLEAVVALCAASKGSAVTLEPFVWGGGGGDDEEEGEEEGGTRSFPSSRGVKRNRSSEPLGREEDVEEEEQEEEEGGGGEDEGEKPRGVSTEDGPAVAAADAPVGAKDTAGGDGGGSGSDGNEATNDAGGEDGAGFEYQDKLGSLDNDAEGAAAAEGAASGMAAQTQGDERRAAAGGEAPKATLEAGLASLDVEDDSPIGFGEVATLMLSQLRRKNQKFRRAAASSLAALLDAFPECCVYELVAPTLLDLSGLGDSATAAGDPIMQARAVACLAAAWPRLPPPPSSSEESASSAASPEAAAVARAQTRRRDAVCGVQREHAAALTSVLSGAILSKVWSVRVPIYGALAAVVSRTATTEAHRQSPPVLTGSLLAEVVQAVELGAEDAKYSQVRAAAVSVVVAMTSRKDLRLALMPHKEGLVRAARTAAEDPEPRVALQGSKASQNLSWWP